MTEHAFYTKDESKWVSFAGPVPRVGELVDFGEGSEYEVKQVKWFCFPGRPNRVNERELPGAEARVLVREVTAMAEATK